MKKEKKVSLLRKNKKKKVENLKIVFFNYKLFEAFVIFTKT
jgi:hypothetical protein